MGLDFTYAHRITKEWDESTVTWLQTATNASWDNAGGDYTDENMATTSYAPESSWEDYDVTEIVKLFMDNTPNYGFCIVSDMADNHTGRNYISSENTDLDSLRPKLTVTYTSNAIIIPDLHSQGMSNGLRLCKSCSGIKLYVPFSGHYTISLYNVNGKKIETVCGYRKQWYQLTETKPSNGVYIIHMVING